MNPMDHCGTPSLIPLIQPYLGYNIEFPRKVTVFHMALAQVISMEMVGWILWVPLDGGNNPIHRIATKHGNIIRQYWAGMAVTPVSSEAALWEYMMSMVTDSMMWLPASMHMVLDLHGSN